MIEQAPLQTYHSALIFSPSTSIVRKLFESQAPHWVRCTSSVPDSWGALLQTLEGHAEEIKSVAFSPNGQKLASGSQDGTVRVWDTASGVHLQTIDHQCGVQSIAFSPLGQKLASGSQDGLRIWDVASGSLIQTFEGSDIKSLAFSPDGQVLASSCDNMIHVRDAVSGNVLHKFQASYVLSVAFSPNEQKLACTSGPSWGPIHVWDIASGSELQRREGSFTSVIFSPDGQKLISGSIGNTIRIWDAGSGLPLKTLKGHLGRVKSLAVFEQKLASGSGDRTIRIWDLVSGSLLQIFEGHSDGVLSVAFSPNGQKLVSGSEDSTVRVWDMAFESPLQTPEDYKPDMLTSIAFSSNGQKIVSVSSTGEVRVWDSGSGLLLHKLEGLKWVSSVAFSPDGNKLACAFHNTGPKNIGVWDVVSGSELRTIENVTDVKSDNGVRYYVSEDTGRYNAMSVAFSPDGQKVAFTSPERRLMGLTVRFWDVASGSRLQTLEGRPDWVRSSALSTDKQLEALNVTDRWVTVNEKRMIWLPPAQRDSVFDVRGTKIAMGSASGIVTILNLDFKQMDFFTDPPPSLVDATGTSSNDVYATAMASDDDEMESLHDEDDEDEDEDDDD